MGAIVCIVCQTKHRTREMYKRHIERKEHKEKQKELWYVNRLAEKKGIFFQTHIFDVHHLPRYSAEVHKEEKKIELLVDTGENGTLRLFFRGEGINKEDSFEHFDASLSIYTIQLVFAQ